MGTTTASVQKRESQIASPRVLLAIVSENEQQRSDRSQSDLYADD